jgi:WbqC-like protein family
LKIAINQPTYLPWIGYFDLIDQVDVFVLLDNVQFQKQTWQQRNRIKTASGLQWLTVPVMFRGRFGQLIKDVEVRDPEFCRNHIRAIELAYRRSPHFSEFFPSLATQLQRLNQGLLVDLNSGLIEWLMRVLEIRTPVIRASALPASGKRTELLANICQALGAKQYVSPLGAAAYLVVEQDVLKRQNVEILFQNYKHPEYRQVFGPFEPFVSVVDLLFNHGKDAVRIFRSGRGTPYSIETLPPIGEAVQMENAASIA